MERKSNAIQCVLVSFILCVCAFVCDQVTIIILGCGTFLFFYLVINVGFCVCFMYSYSNKHLEETKRRFFRKVYRWILTYMQKKTINSPPELSLHFVLFSLSFCIPFFFLSCFCSCFLFIFLCVLLKYVWSINIEKFRLMSIFCKWWCKTKMS